MTDAPLCRFCEIERVKANDDGSWRTYCSRGCACAANRRRQSPAVVAENTLALRAAALQRSREARRTELRAVFGEDLRRDRMITMTEAVELALKYGQKRYLAGYQAGHKRGHVLRVEQDTTQSQSPTIN